MTSTMTRKMTAEGEKCGLGASKLGGFGMACNAGTVFRYTRFRAAGITQAN